MSFRNPQELGKPITIKDEGVIMANSVDSLDFVGAGVTVTGLVDDLTATIPGTGTALTKEIPVGDIDGVNKVFTTTYEPKLVVLNGAIQEDGGVDYSIAGTYTITFEIAPPVGSILKSYY